MPVYRIGATTGVAPAVVTWGPGTTGGFSDVTGYVGGYQAPPSYSPPIKLLPNARAGVFGQDIAGFDYRADNADPTYSTATTTGGIVDASEYGNLNLVPSTSATRPTLNTGGAGGHSYVTHDGVDDRLGYRSPTYNAFSSQRYGLTIMATARFDTAATMTGSRYLMQFATPAASTSRIGIGVDATGQWFGEGRRLDNDPTTQAVGPIADNRVHRIVLVHDYENANQRFYIDGTEVVNQAIGTPGVTSATSSIAALWGSTGSPSLFWQGDVYGQQGVARALTPEEVQADWSAAQADYALVVPAADLSASGTSTTSGSADIVAIRPVTASGAATSTGSAAIVVPRVLSAAGSAASSGSAAIGQRYPVTASGAATSIGSAAIGAQLALAGTGMSQTTGTAQMVGDVPLSAIGTAISTGSAAIVIRRPVAASGSATSSGSAALGVARPLGAVGAVVSSGAGALQLRHTLVATGTAMTLGGAEVTLALALTGDAAAGTDGAANIAIGGLPQYRPGVARLSASPLAVAVLLVRPAARATLAPRPAATAILTEPKRATATLTMEG